MTENEKVKQLAAKAGKDLSSPNHVEDLEFEKLLKYVTELSHQAKSLQTKAINLHRQNKLAAGAYCELIEAINMIADTEESHSDISSALFGGLISLLDTRARQIDGEMNDFSNAVDDFSRWVSAVVHAVNVREDRRFVYQAKLAASSKRDTQHTESQPDGGNTVPSTASQELVEAKEEFEKVHSRIMSEIVRFRMEKSIEFKRLFNNYTQLQLKYHQEMATVLANTSKIMEDSTPSTKLATVVPTISEELINDMKKLDLVTPHTNSSISKPAPAPVLDAKPNPSDPSYADVCL
jgi:hypothetical protein